jgi:hypothetical protein
LSHLDYKIALIRINQIQRGWANYFKHAVAKHTLARLATFVWWRVVRWVMPTTMTGPQLLGRLPCSPIPKRT